MNIAVTGANGFLGKNLIYNLKILKNNKIFEITRKTKKKNIDEILNKTDIIYHFAGVNRPNKKKTFEKDNIELTKYICDYLIKKKLKKKIVFSSSIQVKINNEYGKSKKICENILKNFSNKSKSNVIILRLPNIFGKWSAPNYNSVVSTFCHNVSRGKKINILYPRKEINLLYIDDLIKILISLKKITKVRFKVIEKFKFVQKISLKKISEIILNFEKKRKNFYIENIDTKFLKNLYSTYISYLPRRKIQYKLKQYNDSRGSFMEFLKTNLNGQFSIFIAKKNKVRGHHFHHSKVEKFLVLKGKAEFVMYDVSSSNKIRFIMNDKNPTVVESIPGHQHYIKNLGTEDLIVLLWSNEVFDVKNPDTYRI